MDSRKCQTVTATPAKPGVFLFLDKLAFFIQFSSNVRTNLNATEFFFIGYR